MAGRRPGGVTLVAVLVVINGVLEILAGVLGLAGVALAGVPLLAFLPIIPLVLGILTILVGISLLRGGQIARGITTVVLVLDLAFAIFAIVQNLGSGNVWSGVVSGVLALIGIILLWTRRASEFFRD
ncbi:hypothetical protein GCM10009840_15830 [Pseudolysinimonas kribbensis]|jgi:hypothetical protein|uniref:Phage holin family protein n=1 Tax=Pseudolysinimonas kribbensis TaxID=433641 RepID=A0ABQ6K5C3_9MICO|nr:hypothetical protein [Pseudolysinimonas kribbensis]GMA94067.1 hypothetical protein GCM10025881_08910 [Pseudolysinimonas kribbensis]